MLLMLGKHGPNRQALLKCMAPDAGDASCTGLMMLLMLQLPGLAQVAKELETALVLHEPL